MRPVNSSFRALIAWTLAVLLSAAGALAGPGVANVTADASQLQLTPCEFGSVINCKSTDPTVYLHVEPEDVSPEFPGFDCSVHAEIHWGDERGDAVNLPGNGSLTIPHTYNALDGIFAISVLYEPYAGECASYQPRPESFGFGLAHVPTLTVGPAMKVRAKSAQLAGTANPHYAQLTACHFEYGTTTGYGSTVPCADFTGGLWEGDVPMRTTVSGLKRETEYHFRIVVTNEAGTSVSGDASFTTNSGLPVAVSEPATEVGQTEAVVSGSVNPEGSELTDCTFEYGESASYGLTAPCAQSASQVGSGEEPVAVTARLADLEPDAEYHFRITAANEVGPGVGEDETFTTPSDVRIVDLEFQQPNVGTGVIETIAPGAFTVDGNRVGVIVALENENSTPQEVDVSFESPSGGPGAERSHVMVPAEEELRIGEELDTNGLAWDGTGRPAAERPITVALSDGEEETKTLTVIPKPVVFVHGLNSSSATWSAYTQPGGFLQAANPLWLGYAVGDGVVPGAMDTSPFGAAKTIAQNALEERRYIDGVRKAANAQHVDIVAHSMGGLISRYYLQNLMPAAGDSRPTVSHLVMLGTPNEGSACADDLLGLQFFWNATVWLNTGGKFPPTNQPTLQLTPAQMTGFNEIVTNSRGTSLSVLAGTRNHGLVSCAGGPEDPNDDVVSRTSAWWSIGDRGALPLYHTAMTSSSEAFSKWVLPHLALGPSAGGGAYTGPVTPGPTTRAAPAKGQVVRRPVARRLYARARRSPSKSKICLARTTTAPISFATSRSVAPGKSVSIALKVPRHVGALGATIVAGRSVATQLVDPKGRVVESIPANSEEAAGPFRRLTIQAPQAGTWRLEAGVAPGSGAAQVLVGVEFAHRPLSIGASAVHVKAKRGGRRKAASLRIMVRLRNKGRPVPGAHVLAQLMGGDGVEPVLRARAVRGHQGSYAVQTPSLRRLTPGTLMISATARSGSIVSAFDLQRCK